MRRALGVIAVALATLLAAAWPVVGSNCSAVPTDRPTEVDFNGDGFDDLAIGVPAEGWVERPWPVRSTSSMAAPMGWRDRPAPHPGNPEPVDLFGFRGRQGDFNADAASRSRGRRSQRRRGDGRPGWRGQRLLRLGQRPAGHQPGPSPGNPENSDRFGSAAALACSTTTTSWTWLSAPLETVG